jgi:excisionase family DNA binding protein
MTEARYLKVRDVQERCSVSERTVYEWFALGLPNVKIGRTVRVAETDLTAFLEKYKRQAVPPGNESKPQEYTNDHR